VSPPRGSPPDTLSVALNRERLNGVTAPGEFSATGEFRVQLENDGSPVHVHLRLDGPLASVAETAGSNHYLETNDRLLVDVAVRDIDSAVSGTLVIVTGHGAVEETVHLTVDPPAPDDPVTVDPSLVESSDANRRRAGSGSDARGSGESTTRGGGESSARSGGEPNTRRGGESSARSGGESNTRGGTANRAGKASDAGGGTAAGGNGTATLDGLSDVAGRLRAPGERGDGGVDAALASLRASAVDTGTLLVVGFAVVALALAVGLQLVVGSPLITAGVLAVLVAVAAAGYILIAE
jgi:hypothetical protein